MVQQCVGRFQLLKQTLGTGAYGKVITARDTSSGLLVAAKVISTEDKRQKQLVLQEVTLMQMLEHPNIIGLRGFEAIGRECYIFMELASHGELFGRVLQQGNLTEKEGIFFFAQIMSAVQCMHDQGIIHRDLKLVRRAAARSWPQLASPSCSLPARSMYTDARRPVPSQENVLLDHNDRCKICDFGLAHMYDRDSKGKVIRTTLHEVRLDLPRGALHFVSALNTAHVTVPSPPTFLLAPLIPFCIGARAGLWLQVVCGARRACRVRVRWRGDGYVVVRHLPLWHACGLLPFGWRHHIGLALRPGLPGGDPGPLADAHGVQLLRPALSPLK